MLHDLLKNDLVLLSTLVTLGIFIGKAKVGGVAVSSAGGVLLVALIFGNFGYELPLGISSYGFAFFIYSVGFGAGPRFFESFKAHGIKFVSVAVFVALIASAIAISMSLLFDLSLAMLPGILGGALNSTAMLAAAYELVKNPLISVAYGITYPFGLMGLLLFIQFSTKALPIDLKKEAEKFQIKDADDDEEKESFQKRVYRVQNPGVVEIPLRELNLRQLSGIGIVTIKHQDKIRVADAETKLCLYDHVLAEGTLANLLELEEYLGPEIVDNDLIEHEKVAARVIVTNKKVIDKSIGEVRLPRRFGVLATQIRRGPVEMPVDPHIKLERGDILTLTGEKEHVQRAIDSLGKRDRKKYETDIFMFCFGMLVGVVIGNLRLPVVHTSVGNAVGLLISGIMVGYFRHYGFYSGRMPLAARYILQELGMLFFLATIGLQAGHGLFAQLSEAGLRIFVTGAAVTVFTLTGTLLFCRYVIKFDWNTSFGATTGGVTSTIALKMVTDKAESQYALLGYAGVYAFANILLTLLGQVLVYLPA